MSGAASHRAPGRWLGTRLRHCATEELQRVRRIKFGLAIAAAAGLFGPLVGCAGNAGTDVRGGAQLSPAGPLYIRADRLFTGERLIKGRVSVAVKGGNIVGAGRLRIPRGARVISFRNSTILPGLIDLHVHASPPSLLQTGVTTTRNVGEPEAVLRPPFLRRGYPRIYSSGPMITVPGGYPTRRFPGYAAPVTSASEAAAKTDQLMSRGASVIKIGLLAADEEGRFTTDVER